jgi:hypothetical protein
MKLAAGAGALIAVTGIGGGGYVWGHHAGADSARQGVVNPWRSDPPGSAAFHNPSPDSMKPEKMCDGITVVPGPQRVSESIAGTGNTIADDILNYGNAVTEPLPPDMTREQLVAEARSDIEKQRDKLDTLLDTALDQLSTPGGIPDYHTPPGHALVGPCPVK